MRLPLGGLAACAAVLPLILSACADSGSESDVVLEVAFGGKQFDRPIEVGAFDSDWLFVAGQSGLVMLQSADGTEGRTLLDLRGLVNADSAEGLLSVALDPAFAENGHVWVYFFAQEASETVLARFSVTDEAASLASEQRVLVIPQPGLNQNGGAIRFGPDGMLYLSLGDGSASQDPFENGQNLETLLGSIIRIDVRSSSPSRAYEIPPDNPFVGRSSARPEIWAFGLRNPWRMSFDEETGELWAADVGVSDFEEIDRIESGQNYGWNVFEGFNCRLQGNECAEGSFVAPVAVYKQEEGRCAIIGGVVYRGNLISGLQGRYLFADFCTGEIFALDRSSADFEVIARLDGGLVSSFGTDPDGEVYITSLNGLVWQLTTP